jgi:hypothetical protein
MGVTGNTGPRDSTVAVQLLTTQLNGQVLTTTAGSIDTIKWNTPTVNTANQFNAATELFTVATAGFYQVSVTVTFTASSGVVGLMQNGNLDLVGTYATGSAAPLSPFPKYSYALSGLIFAQPGDVLYIVLARPGTGNPAASTSDGSGSSWSITRIQ